MQNDCSENTLIKLREGTTQQARYNALLDPESVELMGFDVKDWMNFAQEFSSHVKLYKGKDYTVPNGNWEPFHNIAEEVKNVIDTYAEGEITPQLALFICFLKLLNESKKRFNGITKRHLDFYYKNVLQLKKNPEEADSAYIIFELAKNATKQLLTNEALVDAGKDADGNTLNYKLDEEIVINKAIVAAIKNTYAHSNGWHASEIANSGDGKGGELENGSTSWLPFGDENRTLAKKGFSLSAPSLVLTEGKRTITIHITYTTIANVANLKELISIEHTGEKEWINIDSAITIAEIANNKITIKITLAEDAEKITAYNTEIHQGNYSTEHPILRILFKENVTTNAAYNIYKNIAATTLQNVEITTKGVYKENLNTKNDLGNIKLDNPFFPFGPLAKKGAKLKISSDEWIGKHIKDVEVSLDWKDLPDNFESHYQHYKQEFLNIALDTTFTDINNNTTPIVIGKNGDNRFSAISGYIEDFRKKETVSESDEETIGEEQAEGLDQSYNGSNDASENTNKVATSNEKNQQLFSGTTSATFKHFLPQNVSYIPKTTDEYFIQLALYKDFLHNSYAKIYTYLVLNKLPLPNEPYTPFAENLKVTITTHETFSNTKVTLFHEHPFGITKQSNTTPTTLVPQAENYGQLYIGIDKAVADQNIQLLCQLEEGSENPDAIEIHEQATIVWQYLYENTWNNLKPSFLLKDDTDNFLKAGLVAFTVPKQFLGNTLFAEDYLWIRAITNKPFDTVSKFTNIHAQAVAATFSNKSNTLEHLDNGLPAETISKLKLRLATVKKVTQPYASFDGAAQESDLDFYRRISERLRHKNRAITLWDYEHIILQEFDYLHKLKCLNHSTKTSFKAPGEVLLVALPNIVDQNVYDIYKPKLSQAKLNAIQTFINQLNTLHVDALVISPNYEEVAITLRVRFHKNYDPNFYEKQLQNDIAKYLSPWAFNRNESISFGNAMYESEVIFYIENLEYVDYIKDFKMTHNEKGKKEIIPTDQKSILTSVLPEMHTVESITTTLCQS